MNNYIDVLNIMRQFHELEKMKFVMFNKKQLSVFQNVGNPDDPIHNRKELKVNQIYELQYDSQGQEKKINEFLMQDHMNGDNVINKRLLKFYLEQLDPSKFD